MGDAAPAIVAIALALVIVVILSASITAISIRYAHRRGMLDHPGARRSHDVPTPRGGGIGIVVAAIAVCAFERFVEIDAHPLGLILAIALVAIAGWVDDHRGLGVLPRLLLHLVASGIVVASMYGALATRFGSAAPAHVCVLAGLAMLACVWSINLHNFMDGINGLLAAQAVFVLTALAWICATTLRGSAHAASLILWAAAALAFLPFNFPRARVFMGDVGSGVLGLLIAVGVFWQLQVPEAAATSGLVACSAFVTDASCTLISRMLRGKRWYSAHREHLYQWMARTGLSHARVVGWYMGWNLLVVAPTLFLLNLKDGCPDIEYFLFGAPICTAALYAIAIALWIFGKRWCLRKVKSRGHA